MQTKSETLFEHYCEEKGISCKRIGEESERRPDYELEVSGLKVVVEVKQVDPNKEDKVRLVEFEKRGMIVADSTPGAKVRSKIKGASKQISNLAKEKCPGVLVLFDNMPFALGGSLEPYHIRVGMYGFDTIVMTRPIDFDELPQVIERKSGPKKKLTEEHNTSISALAVLEKKNGITSLSFYHNQHAKIPLPYDVADHLKEKQFVLSEESRLESQSWVERKVNKASNLAQVLTKLTEVDRYDIAARITLIGFALLMVILGFAVFVEPVEGSELFATMQIASILATFVAGLPGLYLWVTGFKRFRRHLGSYGPRFVLYGCFTILYAVYIQLRYGDELDHS